MEIFLIRLLQFMLAIGLLVLLHEGGHFFFSKLFGVRVDKFYLFFDVSIAKWKGKLFSFKPKNSDTEYGVGWLPLGGYCKIAGMIDESFDTEQMKQPVQPWEFRSKPAWQRLLIMIGGVLVNFLLALFIYSMVLFHWGETYVPVSQMTQGMEFNDEAKALGFRDGDVLLSTEKGDFKAFGADLFRQLSTAKQVNILRNGKPMQLQLSGDLNLLDMIKSSPIFARMYLPAEVDSVLAETPAAKAGLRVGDQIVAINDRAVGSFNQFTDELARLSDVLATAQTTADSLKVRQAIIVVRRDSVIDSLQVTLTADLKLGFVPKQLYEPVTREYGFFESFPAGIKYGWHVLAGYVDDLKYVFTADGAKSLGGFGAIGSLFPETWDWHRFWLMTAFLSIILAFMNILPIPALDGGHVLFLLYELITRRKPSETFMIRAEYVGFGIIILLMLVANLNDILRWLGYM
ncbi:MAG: RIP metalloprotease RseP [Prevotella sp.]|nr:RIP metalloprotease RseP [Prevotella sp.]